MVAAPARTLLLFDLDGTLLHENGAGRGAYERVFEELLGVVDALDCVRWVGGTDAGTLALLAERHGDGGERFRERFYARYLEVLAEELTARLAHALPGVVALLDALAERSGVASAVATGNMRRGAALKLRATGLAGYFAAADGLPRGGFGDLHEERAALVRDAAAALDARPGERLVVVGDTELDMAAARAAGAVGVGVTTGDRGVRDLLAAGAAVALPDLAETDAVIEALLEAR